MNIQEAKNLVKSSTPSIWSREDVLTLLDKIKTGTTFLSEEHIDQLTINIVNDIDSDGADLVDDYDLSISYREVELDGIRFNRRILNDIVKENIQEYLCNLEA